MKKAFSTLLLLSIITLFSAFILFAFEIKSMQSENIKNEYLQLQAKLHLEFLKKVALQLNDNSINKLLYEDELFELKIEIQNNTYDIFVHAKHHNVALHEQLIK